MALAEAYLHVKFHGSQCAKWDPFASPQRGTAPIFGPYLLRPNGLMDQDATWYGSRPRPRRLCVRWGSRSPCRKKGRSLPNFRPHVYCGQTAGWIKLALGMEVGLSPGDFVLDGDPAPCRQKGGGAPNFRPMSIVAKRLHRSRCHLARR